MLNSQNSDLTGTGSFVLNKVVIEKNEMLASLHVIIVSMK